jgi:hypothetical protein
MQDKTSAAPKPDVDAAESARRGWLIQAIVHPGAAEDGWDIFTTAELEAQVIERLDREMRLERDNWETRTLADKMVGRDADISRPALAVVQDMVTMYQQRIDALEREVRSLQTFDRSDLL